TKCGAMFCDAFWAKAQFRFGMPRVALDRRVEDGWREQKTAVEFYLDLRERHFARQETFCDVVAVAGDGPVLEGLAFALCDENRAATESERAQRDVEDAVEQRIQLALPQQGHREFDDSAQRIGLRFIIGALRALSGHFGLKRRPLLCEHVGARRGRAYEHPGHQNGDP